MSNKFAGGKNALAICDVCGFRCKYTKLKSVVVKGVVTGIKACPDCWDPDHPQLRIGEIKVFDPQALRDPRTDSGEYAASRANIRLVDGVRARGEVGTVTVVVT